MSALAPLIAVVGCDGSGKSTVSQAIVDDLAATRPVRRCHLGVRTGTIGNRIKRVPLIGGAIERHLARKGGRARDTADKVPDLATALVIYALSRVRWRRFRRVIALRRRGVTVVTDRYPQVEVPGFYDGPGLSAARAEGKAIARIAAAERALYDRMVAHRPDLVIRLNIDVATALARKPDHKPASIAAKVAATPRLRFNGAPIVDIDALRPLDEVLATARAAVSRMLAARG